ncbi:hypothetical protein BCR33DRAFT_854548 [Rhizoclosmatium globosum]|uniref:Uncharacterized protein n=1 Tax=Rhizoclosmatium globosum TaxID=329046 RepID=A0A1Y2BSQ9_9FUNG|nr:hypothetical protein BCR33DRAFT_854548 [Rhizoclosmatium globosum]|eukprot:ORY37792.1 hypothetical protein BCR33DRAFT_854548 [Rhizoclosmatium globosum]
MTTFSRYDATNDNLAQIVSIVKAKTVSPTPFPLGFLSYLVYNYFKNSHPFQEPDGRHILAFSSNASSQTGSESAPVLLSESIAFVIVNTRSRQRTYTEFWFDSTSPLCQDPVSPFIQSVFLQVAHFAASLPDAPIDPSQIFIGFLEKRYIPAVKLLFDLTLECLPHNALVFTATTESEGKLVVDQKALDHLNQLSLPIGTRFVVGNEAFVLDRMRVGDIDTITNNNKYPYYRPYIERIMMDETVGGLGRVVRALESLDSSVPDDLGTLPPVSWCLVHLGFSIGLNWTMPLYRRKGLAVYCTAAATKAYRDFFTSPAATAVLDTLGLPHVDLQDSAGFNSLVPHCYTQTDNAASIPLFGRIGYVISEDVAVDWLVGSLKA